MSYDIKLTDPADGETLYVYEKHSLQGGTYCAGGTRELWLNVTYNYSGVFYDVMPPDGIRSIYGKTGQETIAVLQKAIDAIGDEAPSGDYWDSTPGNAKKALEDLLAMAKLRPDGVWDGD